MYLKIKVVIVQKYKWIYVEHISYLKCKKDKVNTVIIISKDKTKHKTYST